MQDVHFEGLVLSLEVRIAADAHDHRMHTQLVFVALRRVMKMHLCVPKVHTCIGQLVLGIIDRVIDGLHGQVGRRAVELLAAAPESALAARRRHTPTVVPCEPTATQHVARPYHIT